VKRRLGQTGCRVMVPRSSTEIVRQSRARCRRCGRGFTGRRKQSRLSVVALALLAVVAFDGAVIVGLFYEPLYGAGLLGVWYALCLAAFGAYERGR
jgi:uncharacterized paraquat-inducible protein A